MQEAENLSELLALMNRENTAPDQRYAVVRRFLTAQARKRGTPISGTFELTPLCNFDCRMCYVHLSPAQMGPQALLSANCWMDLMAQAIDAGMLYASLTGGECLTYPELRQLISFLWSHGVEYNLLTNASLLDDSMADFLAVHRPAYVQVTLYGSNDEVYERVTGRRAFGAVMAGLERLWRARIPCEVAVTPNRLAAADLENQVRLIHALDMPVRINSAIFPSRTETGRDAGAYDIDIHEYIRLNCLEAELNGKPASADLSALPECGGAGREPQRGLKCGAGRSTFSIGWDGIMHPCNMLREISAAPLRDGFSAAWQAVHAAVCEYRTPIECSGCRYEGICKVCVAEHEKGAQPGHANPSVCAWSREMVRVGLLTLPVQKRTADLA